MIRQISESEFLRIVVEDGLPLLVDFTAQDCRSCKALEPVLRTIADEYAGEIEIVSIDVGLSPDLARAQAIMSVPVVMMFRAGDPAKRFAGDRTRSNLARFVETCLTARQ